MDISSSQLARYLSMTEAKVKRSKEAETTAKAKEGKCLACGKAENKRRGLCVQHYHQFLRAIAAMPKRKRIEFEEELIREGRILPLGMLRSIRRPNVFKTDKTA